MFLFDIIIIIKKGGIILKFNPRLRCIDSFGIEQVTKSFYDGHNCLESNPNQSILEAKKNVRKYNKIYLSVN
jgi:hypothetical protein